MIQGLEECGGLGQTLAQRARQRGVRLIWRAQGRSSRGVMVRDGRAEASTAASISGHGIQVISDEGRTALGSRDDFEEGRAEKLLDRLARIVKGRNALQLEAAKVPELEPLRSRSVPECCGRFNQVDLTQAAGRLADLERRIEDAVPGLSLQLSFRAELDAWRVMRSDGTDVLFAIPGCTLHVLATGGRDSRHGVSASLFSPSPSMLQDDDAVARFMHRATAAARLAAALPDAPNHPAGPYPLVIDYALAKGLAHEAFGHASEADGFRSSVLARDGVFRTGERVGAEHVSIIDEPVEGDHAWQPFSSNGVARKRVVVVDRGRLHGGLSDPWSAGPGGIPLSGAARAESFRNAPQPRMTNIRIEVAEPLSAPGEFENYGPEQVRDLLAAAGVFGRHPEMVYLSGYSGGQVNTAIGDFVFQCKAIYHLSADRIVLHKPAIFSGSMFGALESVREAFGPLRLDAIGYCGKWGQRVPSSGGSHYFLVLDPHDSVRLGGR